MEFCHFYFFLDISLEDTNDEYQMLAAAFADNENTETQRCAPGSNTACVCLCERKGDQQIKAWK